MLFADRRRPRGISPDGCGVDVETECPQFTRTAECVLSYSLNEQKRTVERKGLCRYSAI
jgi:hypothetical protein